MINYIIFWALALFIIIANALFDKHDDIDKNIYVNHNEEGLLSCLIVFMLGLACFIYPVIFGAGWEPLIFNLSLYLPVRWILFDLVLNKVRGKNYDYIGDLKPTSSYTDKFLHKVGIDMQYPIKIGLLTIVIIINILIKKYI